MSDTEYHGLVPSSASAPTAPTVPYVTLPSAALGYTYMAGGTNGVAISTPPEILIPTLTASIEKACAALPSGRSGAIVALADTRGVNAAIVQKLGDHVRVVGWVGKSWGAPIAGGASIHASW